MLSIFCNMWQMAFTLTSQSIHNTYSQCFAQTFHLVVPGGSVHGERANFTRCSMCEISGNGSLKYFSRPRNFFWRWKCVKFVVCSLARPGFHPFGWGGAGALPRVSAAQRKIFFWGSIFLNENCILGVFFWPALGKKSCPFFRDSEQLWAVTRHIATFWAVFRRFQTAVV